MTNANYDKRPGQAVITPEMVEAGKAVLVTECGYSGELRTESYGEIARLVFSAMRAAERAPAV